MISGSHVAQHNKIPMGQKIAFGFGMLANQMFPAILGIFMVVLVQDLGFTGRMWSLIFFFPFYLFYPQQQNFIASSHKCNQTIQKQNQNTALPEQ